MYVYVIKVFDKGSFAAVTIRSRIINNKLQVTFDIFLVQGSVGAGLVLRVTHYLKRIIKGGLVRCQPLFDKRFIIGDHIRPTIEAITVKKSRAIQHTHDAVSNTHICIPANFRCDLNLTVIVALDAKGTAVTVHLAGNGRCNFRGGSVAIWVFVAVAARSSRSNSKCTVHIVNTCDACCLCNTTLKFKGKGDARSE